MCKGFAALGQPCPNAHRGFRPIVGWAGAGTLTAPRARKQCAADLAANTKHALSNERSGECPAPAPCPLQPLRDKVPSCASRSASGYNDEQISGTTTCEPVKKCRAPLFILNSAAGPAESNEQLLGEIQTRLEAGGLVPEIAFTTPEVPARELARRAAAEGRELILAGGGDGTVSEIAAE